MKNYGEKNVMVEKLTEVYRNADGEYLKHHLQSDLHEYHNHPYDQLIHAKTHAA